MKLVLSLAILVLVSETAHSFDQRVTAALANCHNHLWEVPAFAELPNAAISVWPGSETDDVIKVYWVVDWTDPTVRAAGQCETSEGEVIGFENYLEQKVTD
ncbi:MAG: hypothetical protein AAGF25_05775 [Pseudomonadota bacterium]